MANVNFMRTELKRLLDVYMTISDCIEGQSKIKSRTTTYLPQPNSSDTSIENTTRYNDYITRALFYNIVSKTLNEMTGQVFMKEVILNIPPELNNIEYIIDENSVDSIQFFKKVIEDTLAYGRCGILTDFPRIESITLDQIKNGKINPIVRFYPSNSIINWRTEFNGISEKLTLVVLKEKYISFDDGFEIRYDWQWRVLSIEDDIYYQTIYRSKTTEKLSIDEMDLNIDPGFQNYMSDTFSVHSRSEITDYDGEYFNEIQFDFVGAKRNDASPDKPPLEDISNLNIGHYRNSADYEENAYICGQATLFYSGLSEDWVEKVLPNGVHLGSRAGIPLPVDGKAGLIQAQNNSMLFEAMNMKEKQMSSLGAKLLEQNSVAKTAFQNGLEKGAENGILSTIVMNVSEAITKMFKKAAKFVGVSIEDINFKLNHDFEIFKNDASDRAQLLAEWRAGSISWEEYRTSLKNRGIAFEDDNKVKEQNKVAIENNFIVMDNSKKPDSQTITNENNVQNS